MLRNNYNRKSILTCFLLFIIITTQAQFNMTAMIPPGGLYIRSQLWNISLSNASNMVVDVQVQLEMKDLQTHQTILSALSNPFSLNPGVGMVKAQSLEPIKYSGSATLSDQSSNGFLPVGQYQVCYQLLYKTHYGGSPVAEDCEQVQVEPLNPPLLVLPENDSVVATNTPNFTWTPPAPPAMFSSLNYDILVCEIYNGQSPAEAIQNNFPLQQATNLAQPFFVYPVQGTQLEEGKKYAWQIVAKDQQRPAARSETWSFHIGSTKEPPSLSNAVYLLIDDKATNTGLADSGFLRIKYVSYEQTHQALISLKDETGALISKGKREIKLGDNYLSIPLTGRFTRQHTYNASFTDNNGKKHSLTFTTR